MKKQFGERQENSRKKPEINQIIDNLWDALPALASDLIARNQDLSIPKNKRFQENPDDPSEHEPNWHQWGIITHTKYFERFYREEVSRKIKEWDINDAVSEHMNEEIDGVSKEGLLNIAVPLHDLGKFTERTLEEDSGEIKQSFKKHEAASGRIIRGELADKMRDEYNLTSAQIEYIARCAELHYELGKVRDKGKKSEFGYTMRFAESDEFREHAKDIMDEYKDFAPEVGLLFLADSLAKTDIRLPVQTDDDIENQDEAIKKTLMERELNPKLIRGVKQLPVNVHVAKHYLQQWAEQRDYTK